VAQAEHDYWTDPKLEAAAPEARKPMFKLLRSTIAAYGKAYRPFAMGEAPWPGVEALPIPGHTPGHTAFLFGHGPESLWVVGDLVHFEKLQFAHSEVAVGFDADTTTAIATRKAIWRRAAKEHPVLAAAHISFPGMGRVQATGEGYIWVPVK
jgi:glyoxylase-like metal-dependent hydrolase (beta-lactamase superfamily II)